MIVCDEIGRFGFQLECIFPTSKSTTSLSHSSKAKTQNPNAAVIRSDGAGRIAYLGGAVFRHGNSDGGSRRHDGALV